MTKNLMLLSPVLRAVACFPTVAAFFHRIVPSASYRNQRSASHHLSPTMVSSKTAPTTLDAIQHSIGSSAKHCVIAAVCVVILKIDSILPTYYVLGAMGNAVLSKVLKKIIREPRPANSPKKGHGMPSSHAQSIYYFAALLCYKIVALLLVGEPPVSGRGLVLGLAALVGIVFYSYYACAYRIATGRHTVAQTVVGAVVGATVAACAIAAETPLLTTFLPVGAMEYTPLWLRYTVIVVCIVGLYMKDAIFALLLGK